MFAVIDWLIDNPVIVVVLAFMFFVVVTMVVVDAWSRRGES